MCESRTQTFPRLHISGTVVLWMVLITGLTLESSARAAPPKVVRITTGESAPYASRHLPDAGVTLKIIAQAMEIAGYQVEYLFYPWKRAWAEAVARDDVQGTAYWFSADWRRKDFHYSDPLITERYVFFHRRSTPVPQWAHLSDLRGLRIGATHAYTYTDEFRRLAEQGGLDVEWVHSDEINFRKLIHGRLDAFPYGMLAGYYLLHEKFSPEQVGQISHHVRPMFSTPQHLLLKRSQPDNVELLRHFNAALKKMHEDGEIDRHLVNLMRGHYVR